MQVKKVQMVKVVIYIFGLNVVGEIIFDLFVVGGGKKLVYIGKVFLFMLLGEIVDFELVVIVVCYYGIWFQEVEVYLLVYVEDIMYD